MSALSVAPVGARVTTHVEPERTAVGVEALQGAIARAYQRQQGSAPTAQVLRALTAQASVETGRGHAMYNFNFGGIKGAGPRGQSATCLTHEVVDGVTTTVRQDFRAYASLDEGAADYVRLMTTRFGSALGAASNEGLGGFAHALKVAGYYTASEADYASALRGAATSLPDIAPTPTSVAPTPTTVDLARLVDALSLSAIRIADPDPHT